MFKSINKNTLVAGLFFFCVLYSLFVMRPFRSAMAAQIGTSDLTYFLLKKIQETKGYVNYKDLSDYLDYQVRKETAIIGKVQTPKVNVSPSARDQWKYWSFR